MTVNKDEPVGIEPLERYRMTLYLPSDRTLTFDVKEREFDTLNLAFKDSRHKTNNFNVIEFVYKDILYLIGMDDVSYIKVEDLVKIREKEQLALKEREESMRFYMEAMSGGRY